MLSQLENEYINILNSVDFTTDAAAAADESSQKKILELIYWLPRVNRYLLTKLSILILNGKLSAFQTNQVVFILKERLDSDAFDHSDYLMFLVTLFNGYSGFDVLNAGQLVGNVSYDQFIVDHTRFESQVKLFQHLEPFLSSHNNCDLLLDTLISTTVPVLLRVQNRYLSTLYGTLSLISQVDDINILSSSYHIILEWLSQSFYWLISKSYASQETATTTTTQQQKDFNCISTTLNKCLKIFNKNKIILNDIVPYLTALSRQADTIDDIKMTFVVINFLISKYSTSLKQARQFLADLANSCRDIPNIKKYLWWNEFQNLFKTI
jgi:hypothetical protein